MPSHRADAPPLRRPRGSERAANRPSRSSRSGNVAVATPPTGAIPVFADSYAAFDAENPLPVPQPDLQAQSRRSRSEARRAEGRRSERSDGQRSDGQRSDGQRSETRRSETRQAQSYRTETYAHDTGTYDTGTFGITSYDASTYGTGASYGADQQYGAGQTYSADAYPTEVLGAGTYSDHTASSYETQACSAYDSYATDAYAADTYAADTYGTQTYSTGLYADARLSTGSAEVSPFPSRSSRRPETGRSGKAAKPKGSTPKNKAAKAAKPAVNLTPTGSSRTNGRVNGGPNGGANGARRRAPGRASHPSLRSLTAPQVGIAGVLGIATIAAPISGAMASGGGAKSETNVISASPASASAALSVLPAAAAGAAQQAIAEPRTVLMTRASRSGERSVLPGCDGVAKITNAPNGRIPQSTLCTLWDGSHRLRADAAVALAKLNVAYKKRFGSNLCLTDTYRTYSEQVSLRASKPSLAAIPGTSNHGWGLAVDLGCGVERNGTSRWQWLRTNAKAYGWENPDWALPGGSGPHEPWHWEYFPGTDSMD